MATFDSLAAGGRAALASGDFQAAVRQLQEALAVWRGELCADLGLGMRLEAARESLGERHLAVTEDLLQARLHGGEDRDLVPQLRELTDQHPLRERLWAYLMLALSRGGQAGRRTGGVHRMPRCAGAGTWHRAG